LWPRLCTLSTPPDVAGSPTSNSVWPFEPASDGLDRPELEDMRHRFQIDGACNKRSRGYDEGGGQERKRR